MGDDIAICFVILAACVVIAWPLWDIGTSIQLAVERSDRRRADVRVRHYAARKDRSPEHIRDAMAQAAKIASEQGFELGPSETFHIVRAALALSDVGAIEFNKALTALAMEL